MRPQQRVARAASDRAARAREDHHRAPSPISPSSPTRPSAARAPAPAPPTNPHRSKLRWRAGIRTTCAPPRSANAKPRPSAPRPRSTRSSPAGEPITFRGLCQDGGRVDRLPIPLTATRPRRADSAPTNNTRHPSGSQRERGPATVAEQRGARAHRANQRAQATPPRRDRAPAGRARRRAGREPRAAPPARAPRPDGGRLTEASAMTAAIRSKRQGSGCRPAAQNRSDEASRTASTPMAHRPWRGQRLTLGAR